MEQMPIVPIYTYTSNHLVQPGVKGLPSNVMDWINFKYLSLDQIRIRIRGRVRVRVRVRRLLIDVALCRVTPAASHPGIAGGDYRHLFSSYALHLAAHFPVRKR